MPQNNPEEAGPAADGGQADHDHEPPICSTATDGLPINVGVQEWQICAAVRTHTRPAAPRSPIIVVPGARTLTERQFKCT